MLLSKFLYSHLMAFSDQSYLPSWFYLFLINLELQNMSILDYCIQCKIYVSKCKLDGVHSFIFKKILCIMKNFKQKANILNINVPKHSTDAIYPKYNSSLLSPILYFILSSLSQCVPVLCPKPAMCITYFIHFILLISNCHQFLLIVNA